MPAFLSGIAVVAFLAVAMWLAAQFHQDGETGSFVRRVVKFVRVIGTDALQALLVSVFVCTWPLWIPLAVVWKVVREFYSYFHDVWSDC